MRAVTHILVLAALSLSAARSGAEDNVVAPELAVPLFLKILTYDQSCTFDESTTVDIYLPYDRTDAASFEQYKAASKYFEKNPDLTVSGARVRFLPVECDTTDRMIRQVDSGKCSMIVLTSMAEAKTRPLLEGLEHLNVRTYTFDPAQISRGIAVGLRPSGGKNAIVVNLAEAQREGARFSAQLLRMCEIYADKGSQ